MFEMSTEEQLAEEIFVEKHTIAPDGKYSVRLPLVENILSLGDSYQMAESRWMMMERRFAKNPSLGQKYINFLKEYLSLKHMERASLTPRRYIAFPTIAY